MAEILTFTQKQEKVKNAAAAFPQEFELTSMAGTYTISLGSSFVNDVGTVQLYLYVKRGDGWLASTKCTPSELRRFIKNR